MSEKKLIITDHAYDRARERAGLKNDSLDRLIKKVLDSGISREETSGKLRRFLDGLYLSRKKSNNIKIYGEKIYLFHNVILITVINLPNDLKGVVAKLRKDREL